jgi:hypothetical protein
MSPLKRQSQNASAAIASCAKEKDFHDRTFELSPPRCQAIRFTEILHGRSCEQLGRYKIPALAGVLRHF